MRAALIVEAGFQDEEFVYPYYRMLEEGWRVDVATPDGKDRMGKYGVPARATTTIQECDPEVLIIPGGFESPDRLRMRSDAQTLVREMVAAGRLVAAICHGPWVLISADVAKHTTMTGYQSIAPDLINAGADYVDQPVVVDTFRNIVTAQHYRDNGPFMQAVITRAACGRVEQWGPELCGAAARP